MEHNAMHAKLPQIRVHISIEANQHVPANPAQRRPSWHNRSNHGHSGWIKYTKNTQGTPLHQAHKVDREARRPNSQFHQ